ncbi:hypothetical protein C6376_36470 [Streptomyces sp. P3]|nr:hypothetical protein C6376_36470 [Streptomyces sp. P3]
MGAAAEDRRRWGAVACLTMAQDRLREAVLGAGRRSHLTERSAPARRTRSFAPRPPGAAAARASRGCRAGGAGQRSKAPRSGAEPL